MAAPSRCRRTLAPLARRGVCFGMTPTPLLSSSAKARSPWSALLETPALLVRNCPVNPPDRFDTRATGNGAPGGENHDHATVREKARALLWEPPCRPSPGGLESAETG